MRMRVFVGGLIAVTLAACAGGPSLGAPPTGTLTGHVAVRACGGAARADGPVCQVRPSADVVLRFERLPSNGTGAVRTATTDTAGAYTIALAPGTYTVTVEFTRFGGPRQVTITSGKTVTADFTYLIEML
jgi:hypothetical protein